MSLSLIKEAQIRSVLSEAELNYYSTVQKELGLSSLSEAIESTENTITPLDYQDWLRVIKEHGEEMGLDLTKSGVFQDIAWEVLDNDPKIAMLGDDEDSKVHIVNTLWHTFNAMSSNEQLHKPRAVEDEESSDKKSKPKLHPDAKLMDTVHGSPQLQAVYKNGMSAGTKDAKNPDSRPQKSKYGSGTTRDKVWKLGYKHGAVGK
jgi:hypothetical protein